MNQTLQKLRTKTSDSKFWDNKKKASIILKKISQYERELELWDNLKKRNDDLEVLFEFANDGENVIPDLQDELLIYEKLVEKIEIRLLLGRTEDIKNSIITIHPGAGGTESQDWVQMLYRMYSRWVERNGFSLDLIDIQPGEEAGLKEVTFEVKGDYAFGLSKSEGGVHRLVRISPFNKQANRHTSFASMHVVPFFEEVPDQIDIEETELRIDTYRSSGAGGQHVNVTDSAVRITHLPSGVVVSCQNERSQHQNKEKCMQMLASKLHDLERQQREDEIASIRGENKNVGFGSQIRSYVMQPYQMVKDLRSNFEIGAVENVLNGQIDPFIESYLRWIRSESNDN